MTHIAVDTSALMSILLGEDDAEHFERILFEHRGDVSMTAANLLETMIVVDARNPDTGTADLRALVDAFGIRIEPVAHDLIEAAFRGWRRFGRGRHPAGLNFGDCFSYALSKQAGAPLLFKGDDFTQTDVLIALEAA